MANKVLFLDFDGVLFDTLKEVYLVNRALFCGIDFLDEIESQKYALFSKYKYLVYNIWMFYYFNPLIFGDCKNIVEQYKRALLNRDIEKENKFCEDFLNKRKELVLNHYDFWQNLETPYNFFFEIKKLLEKNIDMVIISKKNKISIKQRLDSYNFNLDNSKIFAREVLDNYKSKGEFIKEYMEKNRYDNAIFVDDNINNLNSVNLSNVEKILALWGNTEPDSIGYTQERAIQKIKAYFI